MAVTDGLVVFKTSDEVVNNSSILQDDDALTIPVAANERFWFSVILFFDSGTIPNFKYGFSGPSGATIRWERAVSGVVVQTESDSAVKAGSGVGVQLMIQLRGSIEVAGTAGSLTFQWAQGTAHASDTTVQIGSVMIAHKPGTAAATTGVTVFKTTDQTLASSTTLQDDDELKFEVGANETWMFEAQILWDADATPDMKFAFDVPLGATIQWLNVTSGPTPPNNEGDTRTENGLGVGVESFLGLTGIVFNAANAGTVIFKWAQVNSNALVNTVQKDSSIVAHKA